jgi:hypothetical protein
MGWWRLLGLLGAVAALCTPASAEACSCSFYDSPPDALSQADAVFLGRLSSAEAVPGGYVLRFDVVEGYKGPGGRTIDVGTGGGGGDCGLDRPDVGTELLIFATAVSPSSPRLWDINAPFEVHACSRPQGSRAAALAYLRSLPRSRRYWPERTGGCASCAIVDGPLLGGSLTALWLWRRRSRRHRSSATRSGSTSG